MKHTIAILGLVVIAAATIFYSAPATSFVPELTSNTRDKWPSSPTFLVNPSTSGAQITGATPVTTVIANGFATWTSAPNTQLSATNGGTTTRTTIGNDGQNVICFTSACTVPGGFGKNGDTLAITLTTTNSATGAIQDADIVFNPAVPFLTDSVAPPFAQTGTQTESLPTVATHEIGHFFGLDHSGVVRAIMFPQAPSLQTTLSYDDVMGISTNYPSTGPTVATGTISGTIRNGAGAPVFGAHVFAESTTTATPFGSSARKSPISTMSRPDGTYTLNVPSSGETYTVTAEPMDGPAQNSDFGWAGAFGQAALNTNFTTRQR
jgi:matrixin